ncbi:CPBP family intramembrane metalloprotease [Altererythrobacter sp. BO-6]|uniref:CPBP family intramembrane glutamic endopeptidase n=1 Tax=Altererythrobacter sp. BO-6 TaxID=2604537 RepID=UPI0013E16102|nr:CPBP family intramembrane glutamic endopeptidase [Altererythrobacter sp. BO-6]QIG53123.1 CPBP family intramembrane metalloprotease [Altererythrobacter sp. BO-6]
MKQMIFSDEPARGWIAPSIAAPFICILLVAISLLPTDFLLEGLGFTDANGSPKGTMGLFLILASFIAMGMAIFAWVRWVEKRSLESIGLRGEQGFKKFLVGLAVGIGFMGAIVAAIALSGGYRVGDLFPAFASPAALGWIILLLAGFTLQASIEEIAFRGWLFSTIMRRWNVPAAYILTGAAFTFLHFSPGKPLLPLAMTFVFSIFACAWVQRSNSVWGVMGWHTGWNWFGATGFDVPITGLDSGLPALLVKMVPVGPAWLTGAGEGPEGSVFTVALLTVAGLVLLWLARSREQDGIDPSPSGQQP